ncbi:Uncharacterised protein [Klebsiella pneumoniae]|nr:Uncharacterised protein [Klebsiella pneumoniae]
MAGRLMVHALKLAAGDEDISVVARGMEQLLTPAMHGRYTGTNIVSHLAQRPVVGRQKMHDDSHF